MNAKRFLAFLFLSLLISLPHLCLADAYIPVPDGTVPITAVEKENGTWLYLPAFAASFTVNGETCTLPESMQPGGQLTVALKDGSAVNVMRSANLRSVWFLSSDPVNQGRAFIEGSYMHSTETTGTLTVRAADGSLMNECAVSKFRGRGNSTWYYDKRSYHVKLREKADLLDTGIADESTKTWVLLADSTDPTYTRTRIGMGLSMELGLDETARCEPVDLYYDGEYRGVYILCEKVQIGKGRVDEKDYDKIIAKLNPELEQAPPETVLLRTGSGMNAAASDGIEDGGEQDSGAYLLELDTVFTRSDPCWIDIGNERFLAFKNPEFVTKEMLLHVAELFENGRAALRAGGTDPETGVVASDVFDTESFARALIISELLGNVDAFRYSSTFFVLPAGSAQFRSGPLWDFETTLRETGDRSYMPKGYDPLSEEFYSSPEIRSAIRRIWNEELRPLVVNVLLGSEETAWLKPLRVMREETRAAESMTRAFWAGAFGYPDDADPDDCIAAFESYFRDRVEWLDSVLADDAEIHAVMLHASAEYLHTLDTFSLDAYALSCADVTECSIEEEAEADEENYARFRVTATIAPKEGYCFAGDVTVRLNTVPMDFEAQEDGSLSITFAFSDPSYRPFWYEDDDVGLIFDPDWYRAALEAADVQDIPADDLELYEFFTENTVPAGGAGIVCFEPVSLRERRSDLREMYDRDWESWYSEFVAWGYDEWLDTEHDSYTVSPVQDL